MHVSLILALLLCRKVFDRVRYDRGVFTMVLLVLKHPPKI